MTRRTTTTRASTGGGRCPGDDQAGYALAAYIKYDTHYTKVGALFADDVAAQGNVPGLVGGAKNLGLTIVNNQKLALDQTSYATEVQQLKAAHPQVITTESDPQTAGVLLANLKQAGALLPIVGTSGTTGADYDRAAIAAIGRSTYGQDFLRVIQYTATSGPAFGVWKPALMSAPGIKDRSSQLTGFGPETAYDHVTMEALAMLAAHSTTGTVYNSYIPKIVSGTVKVDSFAQGKAALAQGKTIDFVGLEGQIQVQPVPQLGRNLDGVEPAHQQDRGDDLGCADGEGARGSLSLGRAGIRLGETA